MPAEHSADLDVVGIGNALVDVLSTGTDADLESLGLTRGTMALIDESRMADLYAAMGPGTEVSGGSAANTIAGIASLGGRAHYIGRVRDDILGRVFAHDIRSIGVGYTNELAADGPATGCCLILVTPDGERTMNTFLGASSLLGPDDLDADVIRRGQVTYLEGYLFDQPPAQEAFRAAAHLAHEAGREVALTLSDLFCVERHREPFLELVEHHVDVLFANTEEILALYRVDDFDAAVAAVRSHCPLAVLTRGALGAAIVTPEEIVEVPAKPVDVVDTTGDGDLYAAGFLFGRTRGESLATCGRLGAVAASEIISHLGPRPVEDLAVLAEPVLG